MKKNTLFFAGIVIGSVCFSGTSCISRNPQAAATKTERSDSKTVVQAFWVPETMEFVPEEWCKNPRLRKLIITDLEPREAVSSVRKMQIMPDTMDYALLDLSRYEIVFTPDKEYKLIFPTNSVLSVSGDTAKGTPMDSALSDCIFHADKKYQNKVVRARGILSDIYRGDPRDVDYSLIGSVNICTGVKSYIMSSVRRESDWSSISSTALYLVNCVDNRIISMLQLAEDYNDGFGVSMKQAYRIPSPAGNDIILTKMVDYPTDLEPLDSSGISITYSAYRLNDSGELHRIYKP